MYDLHYFLLQTSGFDVIRRIIDYLELFASLEDVEGRLYRSRSEAGSKSPEPSPSCQSAADPPVCRETEEDLRRNAAEHTTETSSAGGPESQF